MGSKLPTNIVPGVVNVPGRDPQAQAVAELLLEQDREQHHSIYNTEGGFHNHLSHHLLAAYDLGASVTLLQAIYDSERKVQRSIDVGSDMPAEQVKISPDNFAKYIGQEKYYHALLIFFTEQVKEFGASKTLESYLFSPAVNVDGVQMLSRFMSGLYHPMIQTGYGAEFGSDAMVAQGLAQAAMHSMFVSDVIDFPEPGTAKSASIKDEKKQGRPLLHILRELYDSDVLKPVPYGPDKSLGRYRVETMKDGRAEEIKRLCASWWSGASLESQASNLDPKVEELQWVTTLLLCGTSKRGRKPRLDFTLVHAMNATLFLPSYLKIIPSITSKVLLLKAFLSVTIMYILARGRPRVDVGLLMSYTAAPRPPGQPSARLTPNTSTIGNANETYNPWLTIPASVIHNPDVHAVKAIRMLYYAAQHYGHKKASDIAGCFIDDEQQRETLPGISGLDGTVFVRAAGLLMDTLGWVGHGDELGAWDNSGLGWEDAWKD